MRQMNPFYGFFTLTLLGLVLTITGAIGWEPSKGVGIFFSGRWVQGPLWNQIGLGIACLIGAAVAFRYASRAVELRATRSPAGYLSASSDGARDVAWCAGAAERVPTRRRNTPT